MRPLTNMRVLITGASSGIGLALSEQLAAAGSRLVISARRVDRLQQLLARLPNSSSHALFPADVSVPSDCHSLVAFAASHLGGLDTLVANAGYGEVHPTATYPLDQIEQIFRTNLLGTTECIRAALPHLQANTPARGCRGQIVIVSSAAARRGLPLLGPYSATKAAQLSIAEALRVELKSQHIAVTTVHPATTRTEFFDVAQQRTGRKISRNLTTGSSQSPDQVARAMLKAIARPTREVWPAWYFRYALSLCTLFPSIGDKVMARTLNELAD